MNMIKLLSLFILISFFTACVEEPTPTNNSLDIAQVVKDQAPLGWQINQTVISGAEINGLTQNSDYTSNDDIEKFVSVSNLNSQAIRLNKALTMKLGEADFTPQAKSFSKTATGDSLIFYEDNKILGIRKALYYNSQTDIARYYEVKYKFLAWRKIEYDSTEAKAMLNGTFDYAGDDLLQTLYRYQMFNADFFVQKIVSDLEITNYNNREVTGLISTIDSYYRPDWHLQHKKQSALIEVDKSGMLREDFEFSDGKTAYNEFTFNANGTGTFEKKLRTGLVISGTFDSAEDDLHGSYSETIDFPGGVVDKIYKKAEVTITLPDSVFNADFTKAVYFTSGKVDSENVALQIFEADGFKTSVFNVSKSNGAHGMLTVVEGAYESTLEGIWTTWDGYYIVVNAEYYFDESAHLHYEVFQSEAAFNEGANPLILADYYFSQDQTGNGKLSYNGEMYDITFDESGNGEISRGDQRTKISLY